MRPRALGLVLSGLVGCAAPTMYRWGGYDDALYQHYKNPQDRDEFVAKLRSVIDEAEKNAAVVPPGCYAEYGWALYEEGRAAEAVVYFEKERQRWPESSAFMDKLIKSVARAKPPAPPAAVPASSSTSQEAR